MSCEIGKRKISAAVKKLGVNKLASGGAYTLAGLRQAATRAGETTYALNRAVSPVSNLALRSINRIEREGLNKPAAIGVRLAVDSLTGGGYAKLETARQLSEEVTTQAGTAVGDLSRDELKNVTVENAPHLRFFRKRTALQAWTSHLTPVANAGDRVGLSLQGGGGKLTHSSGVIIKVDGKTWHSGLVKTRTRAGEHTMQHVRSLSYPPQDYYFDRKLKEKELAQLVSRRRKPATIDGYIGQVSPMDNLAGSWGRLKHNLIRQRILFPPPGSAPGARPPGGRVLAKVPNEKELKRTAKATRGLAGEIVGRLNIGALGAVVSRAAEKEIAAKLRRVVFSTVLPHRGRGG